MVVSSWSGIVDDLVDLSEVEGEEGGSRARLHAAPAPTIDPICHALGIASLPVFKELLPVAIVREIFGRPCRRDFQRQSWFGTTARKTLDSVELI
jgi:hypothetical protein